MVSGYDLSKLTFSDLYIWRFVETAYFVTDAEDNTMELGSKVPFSMAIVTVLFVSACLFFGFHTEFSVDSASEAARVLLEYTK